MNEDNIIWKDLSNLSAPGKIEVEPCKMDSYPSLYLELRDKCNPKKFLIPYDKEKVDVANDLFLELLKSKGYDINVLNFVKEQAIQKLGVVLSTKKLYEKLLYYCNPQNFINPYNHSAIQQANHYYSLINEYRNQLDKLEELGKDIYENEVLAAYYSRKKKREEKIRKQEQEDKENEKVGMIVVALGCLIIIIIMSLLSTR